MSRSGSKDFNPARATSAEICLHDVQDLQGQCDEDGSPVIQHYTFLNWFISEGVYDEGVNQTGEPLDAVGLSLKTELWEPAFELYQHVRSSAAVALIHPKYRSGHPQKYYLSLLSKKSFLDISIY